MVVVEDPYVGNLLCDELEKDGYSAKLIGSSNAVFSSMDPLPDALVLDPILNGVSAVEIVRSLRTKYPAKQLPIIVLATADTGIRKSLERAGADIFLRRCANPVAELLDALQGAFHAVRTYEHLRTVPFSAPERWASVSRADLSQCITAGRSSLIVLTKLRSDRQALAALLTIVHRIATRLTYLDQSSLAQLCGAMESFIVELRASPEIPRECALRTIGDCFDFLAKIFPSPAFGTTRLPRAPRALVVDDESAPRVLISGALRLMNIAVDDAATPAQALETYAKKPYDLIVLDVLLPQMNGFDLCSKIRSRADRTGPPTIFVTGTDTFDHRSRSTIAGGCDYLTKPFLLSELGIKALLWMLKSQSNIR